MKAVIALEDGTIFEGIGFGARGETYGELVFNTSMSGYQEIITDPSYKGQIVTMTYPLIGNYGVNSEDVESTGPMVQGFVIKERSRIPSNWRCEQSLDDYLAAHGIMGVDHVDTRAITKHIRDAGAMTAVISTKDLDRASLVKKAIAAPKIVGVDMVEKVTVSEPYDWSKKGRFRVATIDCGVKYNILRELAVRGCRVRVFPATATPKEIIAWKPDGLMLSNGPGDPEAVPYVVETIQAMLGRLPMFGICLGQQMLGLALGGRTFKLKFGHRGANHPVKDLATGKVAITVQNHGFCVDLDSIASAGVEVTHINLNDGTCEGIRLKKQPVFSVQFHPEASPGPHDTLYMFDNFVKSIEKHKK